MAIVSSVRSLQLVRGRAPLVLAPALLHRQMAAARKATCLMAPIRRRDNIGPRTPDAQLRSWHAETGGNGELPAEQQRRTFYELFSGATKQQSVRDGSPSAGLATPRRPEVTRTDWLGRRQLAASGPVSERARLRAGAGSPASPDAARRAGVEWRARPRTLLKIAIAPLDVRSGPAAHTLVVIDFLPRRPGRSEAPESRWRRQRRRQSHQHKRWR